MFMWLKYRIQGHLVACDCITVIAVVKCVVLQRALTHENEVDRSSSVCYLIVPPWEFVGGSELIHTMC